MGKGGGSPQPSSQTVNQSNLPEYARPYFEDIMNRGTTVSNTAYQPYGGQRVADFTPLQQQGFQGVQNLGPSSLNAPAAGMTGAAGLGGLFAGQNYAQQATSPGAMQSYMSPYMQNVVDFQKTQAVNDYGRQLPGQQAAASRAGAFGGSRQAIVESEAQRNLQNTLGGIQAQGTQQAYEQANKNLQFGSQLGLQGLGLAGQMGQQFGQLGQTAFGQQAATASAQQQAGAVQQAQNQQGLDKRYEEFMQQKTYPQEQLQFLSSLLRGSVVSPNQTQYQYQAPPSAASQIGGLGLGALGLSKAFGAKDGGAVPGYAGGGVTGGEGMQGATESAVTDAKKQLLSGMDPRQIKNQLAVLIALQDRSFVENLQLTSGAKNQQALDAGRQQAEAPSIYDEQVAGLGGLDAGAMEEPVMAAGGGIIAFQQGGSTFNSYVDRMLKREGGYSDNPADRGGRTKYGISSRAYPNLDIKNITPEQAKEIYRKDYWDAIKADDLPESIRERAFDTAVNSGVSVARDFLNRSGGDPEKFDALRQNLYSSIVKNDPSQAVFQQGWNNRLVSVASADGEAKSDAPPPGAGQYGLAATPEGGSGQVGASIVPGYGPRGTGRSVSPISAMRQGIAGQLPAPPQSAANFYVDSGGVARATPNQATPNLPATRPGTALAPTAQGQGVPTSGIGSLVQPKAIMPYEQAWRMGKTSGDLLAGAGRLGKGAISPVGIATSLALSSNPAGAGSDIVPGYRDTSVQGTEDRGDRSGDAISGVISSWQEDADKVYASELALIQKKKDLNNEKGRDKKAAFIEYQTAGREHDALVKQVRETDAKTGRGAIVEKYLPAVAGGQLTPGQSIVPPVSSLVRDNITPAAIATAKAGKAGMADEVHRTRELEDEEIGAAGRAATSADSKPVDKAIQSTSETLGVDIKSLIPKFDSSEYDNNISELKGQASEALKERDVGRWLAVASAGFAMAAGQSRNALTNIAVGMQIGAKEARDVQKEYGARNDLIGKQIREENRLQRAYKLDNQKMVMDATIKIRDLESMIRYRDREGQIKSLEGLLVTFIRAGDKEGAAKVESVMNRLYENKVDAAAKAKAEANPMTPILRDVQNKIKNKTPGFSPEDEKRLQELERKFGAQ